MDDRPLRPTPRFVAVFEMIRLNDSGHLVTAYTSLSLIASINLATPFAIQTMVHTMGADLLRSDRDPLTGFTTVDRH
jgi:diguanylate cyclase